MENTEPHYITGENDFESLDIHEELRKLIEDSPKFHPPHDTWLRERGISIETATQAGLTSLRSEEVEKILGFDPRCGGLGFPYRHPVTGEIRQWRVKPNQPVPMKGGKTAKYLTPHEECNFLYFPPGCAEKLKDISSPLIIN